jgi:type III secretory pathway component EscR
MNWKLAFAITGFIIAFYLQLLGMMNLLPLLVTTPLLFLVIFIIMYGANNRKRFKGFKKLSE